MNPSNYEKLKKGINSLFCDCAGSRCVKNSFVISATIIYSFWSLSFRAKGIAGSWMKAFAPSLQCQSFFFGEDIRFFFFELFRLTQFLWIITVEGLEESFFFYINVKRLSECAGCEVTRSWV